MIDDNTSVKTGEIILCSGIKMDRNYENVLSYSESNMVSLCRSNKIYEGTKYTFIGRDNRINIACPYETAVFSNYVAFINPHYGNKWFFAWVTNVKFINNYTTQIEFKVDVFSTWYSRFNVNEAFIEREHVTDDTPGKNTVPEKLEYGEYVVNDILKPNENDNIDTYYIMATTVYPYVSVVDGVDKITGGNDGGGVFNGIMSGLGYYAYMNTTNGINALKRAIKAFDNSGISDAINSIFLVPIWTISSVDWEDPNIPLWGRVNESSTATTRALTYNNVSLISKPTTVNGYSPVNKKLLQFPYSYFILSNGNAGNAIYKYEYFNIPLNTNYIEFVLSAALTPSTSVVARPTYYKTSNFYNDSENLIGAKLPIAGWVSDTYTNWLTQNAINHKVSLALGMAGIGFGAASMAAGDASGGSNIASGISKVASTMIEIQQAKDFMTPQAEGNLNCGDVNFALGLSNFIGYKMSIKREWAERLDKYFSRFGYQVNEVKTPSLTSRTVFNFVKVGGMDELISGNIPANDLEEINSIFRKGVTIFHDYTKIGNYTISNPIVS